MDKVNDLVKKISSDQSLLDKFKKDPVKTVESLIGIDLPEKELQGVVKAVQSKINLDSIGKKLGGLF